MKIPKMTPSAIGTEIAIQTLFSVLTHTAEFLETRKARKKAKKAKKAKKVKKAKQLTVDIEATPVTHHDEVTRLMKLSFEAFEVGDKAKALEFHRELSRVLKARGTNPKVFWKQLLDAVNGPDYLEEA